MLREKSVEVLETEIADERDAEDIRDIEEFCVLLTESADELRIVES